MSKPSSPPPVGTVDSGLGSCTDSSGSAASRLPITSTNRAGDGALRIVLAGEADEELSISTAVLDDVLQATAARLAQLGLSV